MSVIESTVDRGSTEFAANAQVNRGLAEKLRALVTRVEQGGSRPHAHSTRNAARCSFATASTGCSTRVRLFWRSGSSPGTSSTTTGSPQVASWRESVASAASSASSSLTTPR
jgi:hypothetical protein